MVSAIASASTTTDAVPTTERLRMTYDEYRDWYDKEAGRRGEWVDGEVIVFMPATFKHERIMLFLSVLLGFVVSARRIGVVVGSSYELRTREGSAREPDLQVILNEHLDRITERRLVGAADLVVEIVSPDSVTRDRRDKLAEYAAAEIPEYWVIDPREGKESVEIFLLDDEGRYVAAPPDANGRCWSKIVPGVWLEQAWLEAEELPDVSTLALEMAGNPAAQSEA